MIRSCIELEERLFAVRHDTIALIDTENNLVLRHYPDSLSDELKTVLKNRALVMAGRIGQFKPVENMRDFALLGIDSTKVLVVGPPLDKNGQLTRFDLSSVKYLNLLLELYASTIAFDFLGLYHQTTPDTIAARAAAPAKTPSVPAPATLPPAPVPAVLDAATADLGRLLPQVKTANGSEQVMQHNPYRIERTILEAVRMGDELMLHKAFAIPITGTEGRLAPDELRSLKNHANLVNVLCSRAAIEAGVSYEEAYRLSDRLFLVVEAIHDPHQAYNIRLEIAQAFTRQVKQYLRSQAVNQLHPKVASAILHIRQHVYHHLTVAEVATAMNCHPNYLQRLFKQNTTFSIAHYIRHEKLKIVKELLTYSDESISSIAELLHFSSASHLCALFKEAEHFTPEQYRKRHHTPAT